MQFPSRLTFLDGLLRSLKITKKVLKQHGARKLAVTKAETALGKDVDFLKTLLIASLPGI
jgi:hypothetical protein